VRPVHRRERGACPQDGNAARRRAGRLAARRACPMDSRRAPMDGPPAEVVLTYKKERRASNSIKRSSGAGLRGVLVVSGFGTGCLRFRDNQSQKSVDLWDRL